MKQRDPNWRGIRRHHVVPDKRDKMMEEIHNNMVRDMQDRCPVAVVRVRSKFTDTINALHVAV